MALSICLPTRAVQAIATEDSSTSVIEEMSSSSDSSEDASATIAVSSSEEIASSTETDSSTDDDSSLQATLQSLLTVTTTTSASREVYATITDFEIQHPLGTNVSEIDEGSSFYLVIDWTASNSGQTLQEG